MARLDKQRQAELEPQRLENAIRALTRLGYVIDHKTGNEIQFTHKGKTVKFFVYSGWFTGKTVQDGRGLKNLIKQLKNETN